MKHLREVCPLSRPVMLSVNLTQPVSAPLQNSIRFLPDLIPAPPSISLATSLPLPGSATGLLCSVEVTRWSRCSLYAGSVIRPGRNREEPPYPLQEKPVSIFGFLSLTTLSKVCICSPCHQPWALTALMLADTSLPRGFDADLSIAGTLSERFRQVVAFPL